jgi:DNA repair exonuclease SbcCD nuclease subunit
MGKKICILGDTHYGIRGDNIALLNYFKIFFDDIFFPELIKRGITHVVHLGDLVDRRKYINYNTARRLRIDFLQNFDKYNIKLTVIAGNHDVYYKNTNELSSLEEIVRDNYKNVDICTEPKEKVIDNVNILLLPWINDANYDKSMELIESTNCKIVCGHLELAGFEYHKGHIASDGENPKIFDKFGIVLSGHYHTKSNNGHIHYVGTPCQFTWADYMDQKGFHILDTETLELEYIENPYTIFHKLFYNERDVESSLEDLDFSIYKNCYVKVVIRDKEDNYLFDQYISKLEKSGVLDIQVVEDHLNLNESIDLDLVDETQDTVTILKNHVSNINFQHKPKLEKLLVTLYHDAMLMET